MIADFHNDYLVDTNCYKIINNYVNSDNLIVSAIFRGRRDFLFAKYLCKIFSEALNERAKLKKPKNLFLAFEDFGYECDMALLRQGLLSRNPCYVGLTWNGENNLAFGCGASGRIKPRGTALIKELNKRKIAVDTAHLSKRSFYDVIDLAQSVVCSHTCFYDVNQHERNIDFYQIKQIVERGGLVGLTLYTPFLTEKGYSTVEDVYKHVDYFANHFGVDYLAIGTDFYGCDNLPKGFKDYSFEYLLTDFLLSKGYKASDVNKILYGNLKAFLVGNKNRQTRI